MPFAFVHLITAWTIGKSYELISKRKIKHHVWFFLLIGSILPDADFLLDWTIGTSIHRSFTHSLTFAAIISLLVYLFFSLVNNKERIDYAFFIFIGILSHLALDMISVPGILLFWPSSTYYSYFAISNVSPSEISQPISKLFRYAIIDMAIGIAWIFYLWFRRKIRF